MVNLSPKVSPLDDYSDEREHEEKEKVMFERANSLSKINKDWAGWKYSFWGSVCGLDDKERQYQAFMSEENSAGVHFAVAIVGTVVNVLGVLEAYLEDSFSLQLKTYFYQRMAIVLIVWLHLYCVMQTKYPVKLQRFPVDIVYIGDCVLVVFPFCWGLSMYGMASTDKCNSGNVSAHLMCDHIPIDSILTLLVVNMLFSVLVKSKHIVAVVMSIVIEFFFMTVVVYLVEPSVPNIGIVISMFFAQCFVSYEGERYPRRLYMILLESRSYMQANLHSENEKKVMEMQSRELRFLIANVAHDLKTPLQAFSFELEAMKRQSTAGHNSSILLLESICSFMLMTINRAIDYTKVKSGIQLKPSMETVDVGDIFDWVQKCVARTSKSIATVPIVIEPIPEDMCHFIITDKQWLMENLLCLISNAQKFTAHGAIVIKCSFAASNVDVDIDCGSIESSLHDKTEFSNIRIASTNESTHETSHGGVESTMVLVEVIDEGIGISEEMQKTLFKPFKQAMRRAGGTGLGIYSLSKRVESLGGMCGVSSRVDGKSGARFWFTLPYRPDLGVMKEKRSFRQRQLDGMTKLSRSMSWTSPECEVLSTTSFSSTSHSSDFILGSDEAVPLCGRKEENEKNCCGEHPKDETTAKILLVEDSPLIQKTCGRMLLREGISVDVASNGLECVSMVQATPDKYDLLLMDVNMPLMDGLEATARIRDWENDIQKGCTAHNDIENDIRLAVRHKGKMLIIGVSANSDSVSKQEGLDAGMNSFISKPMTMSMLKNCLAECSVSIEHFIST